MLCLLSGLSALRCRRRQDLQFSCASCQLAADADRICCYQVVTAQTTLLSCASALSKRLERVQHCQPYREVCRPYVGFPQMKESSWSGRGRNCNPVLERNTGGFTCRYLHQGTKPSSEVASGLRLDMTRTDTVGLPHAPGR